MTQSTDANSEAADEEVFEVVDAVDVEVRQDDSKENVTSAIRRATSRRIASLSKRAKVKDEKLLLSKTIVKKRKKAIITS